MLQPPERLRATIIDTMGRPLLILIGSGDSFTLVNSPRGEALIGTVYGLTRETDRPVDLQAGDVISLLTGRFFPPPPLLEDMRRDKEIAAFVWLYFSAEGDIRHNILFDPQTGRIMRDILHDGEGNILLDVRYLRENEGAAECSLPDGLVISGDALGGEVTLKYDLVMRPQAIPDNTFELELPEHFVIKRMD